MSTAGVIICRPSGHLRKRYLRCSTCECITEMVARYEYFHGATYYCCRCGDTWWDGELGHRPFARNWRQRAVRRHREMWDRATFGPAPDWDQWYDGDAS